MMVLATLVVGAGIYVVDQFDSRAAWLLAFLVLLGVAFGYKDFGNQLTSLLGGTPQQQSNSAAAGQLMPGQQGPLPVTPVVNGGVALLNSAGI